MLIKELEDYERIGSGAECVVFKITNKIVYKCYNHFTLDIYKRAEKAAKFGIGPEVYGYDKNGYFTEKVKPLSSLDKYDYNYDIDILEGLDKFGFTARDLTKLQIKADSILGRITDIRAVNLGVKKGNLVFIDFGPLSSE